MGHKNLAARSPFQRKGSASAKIYAVLAKSAKALPAEAIAKRAKITEKQARTLLAAYMNPFHNAPLRRAGVAITSNEGLFSLAATKATPNAKRPVRGAKKVKANKAKKSKGTSGVKRTGNRKSVQARNKTKVENAKPAATNAPDTAADEIVASPDQGM